MKAGTNQRILNSQEGGRPKEVHPVRLTLRIAAGFLIAAGLHCTGFASTHAADPIPTIRIAVLNFTEATPQTIAAAEREAGRILGDAGLNVVWVNCPPGDTAVDPTDPCQQRPGPSHIFVRVLGQTRQGFQDSIYGFAVLPALASAYYGSAVQLARDYRAEMIDLPTILGCVMAHEIGHLLLGSNSHSATGIMQAHWGRKQVRDLMMGTFLFTPQQSKVIRAEGQARMNFEMAQVHTAGSIS